MAECLSNFLRELMQQRNVNVEELAKECDISKSTLYRYFNESKQFTPKMESTVSEALNMTTAEQEKFRKLIALTVDDDSFLPSRIILDDLIFATGDQQEEDTKGIDFVFHAKDCLFRSSMDMARDFLKHSDQDMFRCDIKVVNCLSEEFLSDLQTMLTWLITSTDAVSVEHLLEFPARDYLTCTRNLSAILPLLSFSQYNVLYSEIPYYTHSTSSIFRNIIFVETSWEEEKQSKQQYFLLSYVSGFHSQSTVFDNKNLYRFYEENYQNLRKRYKKALVKPKNMLDLTKMFTGMEKTIEQVILKPTPCYHKIPIQVYNSIIDRISPENKKQMQLDSEEEIVKLKRNLEMRYSYAHKEGNVDVLSKSGLLAFAEDGLLADHIDGLPPFDKKERKMIFQSLREHIEKKSKGYSLHITKNDINIISMALRDRCVAIKFSYDLSENTKNRYPFVVIDNKVLAEVFFDYATYHVPAYHTLPKEEAMSFLDELIEMMDRE